ncbi:rCG40791 [Rattus norvegicus]|uniref:RCG40791 n=1 Tax=Rattus norvegicus TaxID=10116 RepID=A6KNX9_RAT|nr:rCG40791 [Rattus norvegicus]
MLHFKVTAMGRCRAPLQSTPGLQKPACCHHLQRKSGFHLQLIVRPKERPAGLLKHSQPGCWDP